MINTLQMKPMQLATTNEIRQISQLDERDYDCMREVQETLIKHGKQNRFGVTILYSPFDLKEGEVMMEYTNISKRRQVIKAVPFDSDANSVETVWRLTDGKIEASLACVRYCGNNIHGNHDSFHK